MKRWSVGALGEFESETGAWVRFSAAEAEIEQARRDAYEKGRTDAEAEVEKARREGYREEVSDVSKAFPPLVMRKELEDLKVKYAAFEAFCDGLRGVNDELRGKLSACEKERDGAQKDAERVLERAESAEKQRDKLQSRSESVPAEKLEAFYEKWHAVYPNAVMLVELRALLAEAREGGKPHPKLSVQVQEGYEPSWATVDYPGSPAHSPVTVAPAPRPAPKEPAPDGGLREWAEHRPTCGKYISFAETNISPRHSKIEAEYNDNRKCTCGLDAALAEAQKRNGNTAYCIRNVADRIKAAGTEGPGLREDREMLRRAMWEVKTEAWSTFNTPGISEEIAERVKKIGKIADSAIAALAARPVEGEKK